MKNNLRSQFPILNTQMNGHNLIYLDSAATSQKPQVVIDAMNDFYSNQNASSHSVHTLGGKITVLVEQTRQVVADFVGVKYEEIVFTSGATEGLNLVANGFLEVSLRGLNYIDLMTLPVEKTTPSGFACHPSRGEFDRHSSSLQNPFYLDKDSEILICVDQHHSNILPWQRLAELAGCKIVFFGILADGRWDLKDFESKLNVNTKVLAISNVSNVLGVVQDVAEIMRVLEEKFFSNGRHIEQSEISYHSIDKSQQFSKTESQTHQTGSFASLKMTQRWKKPIVVLDATQAVSHFAVDVTELDVDFLVFSGHKIYGPTGVGVLYGKRELLQVLPNYKVGGDMVDAVSLSENIYKESPFRFEAGTANFGSIIGLKAVLDWFTENRQEIFEIEEELFNYLVKKLKEIEELKILGKAETLDYPVASQQPLDRGNLGLNLSCTGAGSFASLKMTNIGKDQFRIPIISFKIKGVNSLDLALLLDQKGVCIRSGQHCAGILHEYLGVDSSCRISLACFNTVQEIDFVIKHIKDAVNALK